MTKITIAELIECIEVMENQLGITAPLPHHTSRLVRIVVSSDYVPSESVLDPNYSDKVSAVDIAKHHISKELVADLEAHVELVCVENKPIAHERSEDDSQVLVESDMADKPTTDAWGTW